MRAFKEYFRTPLASGRKFTGLFGVEGLTSPSGLTNFAKTSLVRAQSLASELMAPRQTAPNGLPGAMEIRKLDELSDTLCKVVDMAAFLRITHPNPGMADAAQQAHELLFGFMNELNTSHTLFKLVEAALQNPGLSREERKVGEILLHDFLKSGIQFDTDPKRQQKFVELSNDISVRSQHFLMGCGEPREDDLVLSMNELSGVSSSLLAQLLRHGGLSSASTTLTEGKVRIPASQPQLLEHILATANSSATRQKTWQHARSASPQQIALLDGVLGSRQQLAHMAGYDTFANYELSDKMMHNSENVIKFLTSLATTVKPLATTELAKLGGPQAPWDYLYYLTKYRSQLRRTVSAPQFELTKVFAALNQLMEMLYGLTMQPGDIEPGEVWSPEVRRLDVFDNGEKVGIIYCDLLTRAGKQPNPAHFTIQCSRTNYADNTKQLPIIALVCDFEPQGKSHTVWMQYHEVQTLFHEMGHALHSMIGRTKLHNVAGTRCSTDFVELPSILFEKFASDPWVLQTMKPDLDASSYLVKQRKKDSAVEYWETWHQLCLSFLDQALHGLPFVENKSSVAVANQISDQFSLFAGVPLDQQRTLQFGHFGHLVSYGATYYSYLFDRCLAGMTWDLLFKDQKQWSNGGHQFKNHVLQWGGGKDPQECLESLFGKELDHKEVAKCLATT